MAASDIFSLCSNFKALKLQAQSSFGRSTTLIFKCVKKLKPQPFFFVFLSLVDFSDLGWRDIIVCCGRFPFCGEGLGWDWRWSG